LGGVFFPALCFSSTLEIPPGDKYLKTSSPSFINLPSSDVPSPCTSTCPGPAFHFRRRQVEVKLNTDPYHHWRRQAPPLSLPEPPFRDLPSPRLRFLLLLEPSFPRFTPLKIGPASSSFIPQLHVLLRTQIDQPLDDEPQFFFLFLFVP